MSGSLSDFRIKVVRFEIEQLLRHKAINCDTLHFTACDPSCASCFPDNPKCMSCVAGTALHHGKCIPHCPTHNYLDAHGRCRGRRSNPCPFVSPSSTFLYLFIPFSPQPATAPAPPAGDPRYPSAPCVLVGSSCTRASVWRPVGRVSTLRTAPATVRACFLFTILVFEPEELMVVTDEWTWTTCFLS